jgi:hypothetical protein
MTAEQRAPGSDGRTDGLRSPSGGPGWSVQANRKADRTKHNGKDLRPPPLSERNAKLARLLARARTGIGFNSTPTGMAPWCSRCWA